MFRIWLYIGVLAMTFGAGSLTAYKFMKAGEVKALNQTIKEQNDALRGYEDALVVRDTKRREAEMQALEWKRRWRELQTAEVKQWAETPVPVNVRNLLLDLQTDNPDR